MNLRPAVQDDAAAIASIHRTAYRAALPHFRELHSPAEDLAFFRDVLATHEVWIAELDNQTVGFVAFRPGWIDHLYVLPSNWRVKAGQVLLDMALRDGAQRQLWTFQANDRARRFYESNGFVAVEFTDGSRNEEQQPDMRYMWRG
jgi:GNAT superfamily N-acetyltransferase